MLRQLILILAGVLLISLLFSREQEYFTPLFDGESLDGWTRRGGEATYRVEVSDNGGYEIVGTAKADTPNTFLCTNKLYGDFILEFEVKVDRSLNSGVQFRSECFDEPTEFTFVQEDGTDQTIPIAAGRVHGYQVEIDPSDRAWSGGVYDEGRRGWLFNLEGREKARQAFDPNGWNQYRVETSGEQIRTFVNGVPAADFNDNATPRGFIALQVHSIGSEDQAGKEIRWRNLHISEK